MTLSILIVNWNSKEHLRVCLHSVRSFCADLETQVIVVDSASFDGCSEMLAAEFPEVEFVQSAENLGFGRANNLGFERATGAALLLLNPDTELTPFAVQTLMQELWDRPDAGIIGPRLLNSDGTLQTSCVRALPTPLNRAVDSNLLRRVFPSSGISGVAAAFRSTTPVEVEAVSGACMLLNAKAFRQVGGFSPEFFMYGEDMDLCAKLRRSGLKNYHVPQAEVVHHGGGSSSSEVSSFSTLMMRVSSETYMRLNHGTFAVLRYRLLQAISAVVRLTLTLPTLLFCSRTRRSAARATLTKWWHVLGWAVGVTKFSREAQQRTGTDSRTATESGRHESLKSSKLSDN